MVEIHNSLVFNFQRDFKKSKDLQKTSNSMMNPIVGSNSCFNKILSVMEAPKKKEFLKPTINIIKQNRREYCN